MDHVPVFLIYTIHDLKVQQLHELDCFMGYVLAAWPAPRSAKIGPPYQTCPKSIPLLKASETKQNKKALKI
jgi:hypothetical protein